MQKKRYILFLLGIFLIASAGPCASAEKEAMYWRPEEPGRVHCLLCPRSCLITEGARGFCGVRINRGGTLYTLGYNNPVSVAVDPIEKKPFFHVLPGTGALSLAVAGCNLRCLFCQNWHISQKKPDETVNYDLDAAGVVALARKYRTPSVVFTYTEPTVFYEYMIEVARAAKEAGLFVGMHSCGYINREPLIELLQYMDFVNVDLKSFDPAFYQELSRGAELSAVLESLKVIAESGVHLEITTLLIPTKNDSPEQIRRMCEWIRDTLGAQTPLHFSRFYPQFQLENLPPTPVTTLKRAYRIARETGLLYVYIGNVPGIEEESTFCPRCGEALIRRSGYSILENRITPEDRCPRCGMDIHGVWR